MMKGNHGIVAVSTCAVQLPYLKYFQDGHVQEREN